jgi:hypothetical protein
MALTRFNPYEDSPNTSPGYTENLGTQILAQTVHTVPNTMTPYQDVTSYGGILFAPSTGLSVNTQTVANTQTPIQPAAPYSQVLGALRVKLAEIRGQLPGAG